MSTRYETDPGSKSAEEVQREAQESRAEVEEAIEAIAQRLSPGQLFDEAVAYMRGSGGQAFMRNLGATVRDNPVPMVLMSTGLAWLMLSGSRSGRGHEYEEDYLGDYAEGHYGAGDYPASYYPGDYRPEYDDDAVLADSPLDDPQGGRREAHDLGDVPGLSEGGGETARSWGAEARATAQEWSAGARSAVADAGERAHRLGADARARLGDSGAYLRHGARGARARAGRYGRRAQRGFFDMLHEQPLVLGAVGLAVGAAIGAALPTTETEDEWLGDTRDRLKDRAARLSREQLAKARAAGRAAYETAIEEADRQGLTAEGAMAAVDAAARKAERVAEAATEAAKTEAERQKLGQTESKPL
jgi:Protein of unknown function (DUF3618)